MQTAPQYAGFWIRTAATIIDVIVLSLVIGLPLTYLYGADYWMSDTLAPRGTGGIMLSYVLPILGTLWFWMKYRATPGKILTGIQIVDAESFNTMTLPQAVGRYFAYMIAIIPLAIGVIWVAFDHRKQGWHDKLAKTVVIRE